MPPDAIDAKARITRSWLVKAAEDLRAAKNDLRADPPLLGSSAFHCQQAVEKALKGFLTWKDRPFAKIHDLELLSQSVLEAEPSARDLLAGADQLTAFATVFRYPGELDEPPVEEVRDSIELAGRIVAGIVKLLPKLVAPIAR